MQDSIAEIAHRHGKLARREKRKKWSYVLINWLQSVWKVTVYVGGGWIIIRFLFVAGKQGREHSAVNIWSQAMCFLWKMKYQIRYWYQIRYLYSLLQGGAYALVVIWSHSNVWNSQKYQINLMTFLLKGNGGRIYTFDNNQYFAFRLPCNGMEIVSPWIVHPLSFSFSSLVKSFSKQLS